MIGQDPVYPTALGRDPYLHCVAHQAVKEGAVSDGAVWVIGTAASNVVVAYADQQLPRAAAVETTNEHTQQCRHVQYVESEAKHRQRAY